jgi:hypothetical protein
VGPRAGLDTEARGKILSPLPGIEPRSPGRPDRSQTLYRLTYLAHDLIAAEQFSIFSQCGHVYSLEFTYVYANVIST